ncbi:MAG: MFS transporter [Xanthobacteraceae bacterium]|nr:MFS transporter [Xanthobacteraceae bacterium]
MNTLHTADADQYPADHAHAGKSFKGATLAVAMSVFLNVAGFTLIIPVVPFLIGRYVPSSRIGLLVGLIVSIYAACSFFAAPVLGALSDRFGRRPILVLSLLGSAVGYVIFGIGGALWVLFAGRIIDGLTAGNISTMFAYVADTTAPAERGRVYGLLGAVGGLGFMLGPVAGGLLGAIQPTMPLFAAALLTIVNIAWVCLAMPESVAPGRARPALTWRHLDPLAPLSRALGIATLRSAFAAAFLFFFAGAMLQSNLAVYLKDVLDLGPGGIGWILFGVGVMDIVSQGVLARTLLPYVDARVLARSGLVVNAVGFALIAATTLVPHAGFLLGAIMVFALGDGLFQPSVSGMIANAAPADAQGLVQGANQAQQALARMLGPLLGALLYSFGAGAPYWAGAGVALAAAVVLGVGGREPERT